MATQTSKAKSLEATPKKPSVARADLVDKATRARFASELDAAIKRKPTNETKLAGAIRAVARLSPALRGSVAEATATMVKRGSFARELYGASIRTLAEADDRTVPTLLKAALGSEEAGGNATLSAASFCKDPSLAPLLAKLAASRQSHLAFGAETARVCRRESNGAHLTQLAPMIKESHRISLCVELFVPLVRGAPVPVHVAPALSVLRGAERHLGRWLVMADVAVKAGDRGPLEEAVSKAQVGPASSRSAWSLVAWSLSETAREVTPQAPAITSPTTRPTVELVARLSDRPSADRDTTFLFRMARARATSCKPMLEALVKAVPLADEVSVRAASFLARDHGRVDLREALVECATNAKRDELRGLAVAALWDSAGSAGGVTPGVRARARDMADELVASRCLSSVAWSALVRAAHTRESDPDALVVAETPFRWIQWGWLE